MNQCSGMVEIIPEGRSGPQHADPQMSCLSTSTNTYWRDIPQNWAWRGIITTLHVIYNYRNVCSNFKSTGLRTGHDLIPSSLNEGEKWKTSTKVLKKYTLVRYIITVILSKIKQEYISKYTKTCLALLAFMTVKPFYPTLKLWFISSKLKQWLRQLVWAQPRFTVCRSHVEPLRLTHQDSVCWGGPFLNLKKKSLFAILTNIYCFGPKNKKQNNKQKKSIWWAKENLSWKLCK